ncbi:MAG: hypothetical protein AAGJ52_00765 [Pseudomonadota bacterium]
MQKFLIGCGVVLLVVVVGGGSAAWFFVVKPAWEFASDTGEFITQFQDLNSQIESTEPFEAPADGNLDSASFQRFLVAQRDMRGLLQTELQTLEGKWDEIQQELDSEGRDANLFEVVTAYRDLGGLLLTAKQAQVEVLNRYQFSLDEYVWVRNQTYRALGEQIAVTALGEQGQAAYSAQVSEEVIALVTPHRDELMESYVMAWFGL